MLIAQLVLYLLYGSAIFRMLREEGEHAAAGDIG